MATIQPIESRTVHQIQSGQVIVDLCSVVKELVENSLDAGAKSIEVRFKNQGLESIEVQDNGDGVPSQNYETLALKHYTSKLSTYDDLATLHTFGFRGEALSSLCAVSRFSVTTCLPSDAPKGTKLEFEISGQLKKTSVVSAQKGTIVTVEDLFNNLPVRRQELERNIKREWNRVVVVLGQYACIQTGVKFTVTQQAGKGNRTTVISTKGNPTTRDNLVNVFGPKVVASLNPLELKLELDPTSASSQRWSTQVDGGIKVICISGWISRPASGEGRQTPDRQMFYVNSRPCLLPQISRAFNEVYKSYNSTQSPFIFANIKLDTHMYDVNLSPDKRTILLHDQSRMLENIKTALTELFNTQDHIVPVSQLPVQKQPGFKQLTVSRIPMSSPSVKSARQSTADRESCAGDATRSREASPSTEKTKPNKKAVPRKSMDADRESINLITPWTTRNVDDRPARKTTLSRAPGEARGSLSREKQRLVAKLRKVSEESYITVDDLGDPSISDATSSTPPSPVENTAYVANSNRLHVANEDSRGDDSQRSDHPTNQPNIPSIVSSTSNHSSYSIFSNTRSQPVLRDVATITVGDHTITQRMGPSSTQKLRREGRSSQAAIQGQEEISQPLSLFGNTLSQRFAASTATLQHVQHTQSLEDENEDDVCPSPSVDGSSSEVEAQDSFEPVLEESATNEDQLVMPVISIDEPRDITATEEQKRADNKACVDAMIKEAESAGIVPSQENALRSKRFLKGVTRKKDATVVLSQTVSTSIKRIAELVRAAESHASTTYSRSAVSEINDESLDSEHAEKSLSLTVSKSDFSKMRIIGQFNLGFILATRAPKPDDAGLVASGDLFIIDQHASDEKYNFERLQATTIVQSQRLVQPKTLDLTALEEEIVMENLPVLESNGFVVSVDQSGDAEVGRRCQLVSLPLSRETTFGLADLEELLALLSEHPLGSIPRPSKVRKMFAMRACRSSIMIGKTLTNKQMAKVVQRMGEIDKPWNCPHGRPTMRHLCGLSVWDDMGWREDGVEQDMRVD